MTIEAKIESSFPSSKFDPLSNFMRGIAVDKQTGKLWIVDGFINKIYNTELDGTLIETPIITTNIDPESASPNGISSNIDGTLFYCDTQSDKVYQITKSGVLIQSFSRDLFCPDALMTSVESLINKNLKITSNVSETTYETKLTGELLNSFTNLNYDPLKISSDINGIAEDPIDQTFWLIFRDNSALYHVKRDFALIDILLLTDLDSDILGPTGIAIAEDLTFWICDTITNEIYNISIKRTITPKLSVIGNIYKPDSSPDPDGKVIIYPDIDFNNLAKYDNVQIPKKRIFPVLDPFGKYIQPLIPSTDIDDIPYIFVHVNGDGTKSFSKKIVARSETGQTEIEFDKLQDYIE